MDKDGCYVHLYFYDKLSSPKSSDMSDPSEKYIRGIRFSSIRRDLKYALTPLFIFLSTSQWQPRRPLGDLLPPPANLQGS
jgi:hypothetical protein